MNTNSTETAKPRRRWVKVLAWVLAGLAAVVVVVAAGAGGAWWLYGWRLGDAGVSACRDPELQQVLRRIDEALYSPATEAQVRKGLEELTPLFSDASFFGVDLQPDIVMKFVGEPARALIRRAAAEGRADVRDENGLTLLFVAVTYRLSEPVHYLLEHGCDPNQLYTTPGADPARYQENTLTRALCLPPVPMAPEPTTEERIAELTLLCRHGASWEQLPLASSIWAIALERESSPENAERLFRAGLELGYRPDFYGDGGPWLFGKVCSLPHATELAEELLQLGYLKPDLNAPMGDHLPLVRAVNFKNSSIMTWLLEHGADPNAREPMSNRTALDEVLCYLAVEESEDLAAVLREIRDVLLKHGAKETPWEEGK